MGRDRRSTLLLCPVFGVHYKVYLFTSADKEITLTLTTPPAAAGRSPDSWNLISSGWVKGLNCAMDGWQLTLPEGIDDTAKLWLIVKHTLGENEN
jgi:hypothetical protein